MKKPSFYPEWCEIAKDGELHDLLIKKGEYRTVREGHKNSELAEFTYNIIEGKNEKVLIFFDYRDNSTKIIKDTLGN